MYIIHQSDRKIFLTNSYSWASRQITVHVCTTNCAGLGDTQRQARELISGPTLGTRAKFLTFNRIQSRVVTDLLMGHNTLRRHLHLLGLHDSPLCRKCGVRDETSAHILCECKALASLRHVYLGSFFLEPKDIRSLGLGAIWNYSKATGLLWFDMGHKGPVQKA